MSTIHEGGCLCRDVRYETTADPIWTTVCHCTFCQKLTGSAFLVEPIFKRKTVAFSASYEGPTEVYTMPASGGLPTRRTFEGGALVAGWTPDGKVLYKQLGSADLLELKRIILANLPSDYKGFNQYWKNN